MSRHAPRQGNGLFRDMQTFPEAPWPPGPSLFTHSGKKSAAKVFPFLTATPTVHIEYTANARKSYLQIALKACTFPPSSLRQLKRSSG